MEMLSDKDTNELTYTIQNIVVKSYLEQKINLDQISKKIENVQYNAKTFPGLFIRYSEPKSLIILFKTGRVVLTGLLKFIHIHTVMEKLILDITHNTDYKINVDLLTTEIVNIVITANYYKRIDLNLATIRLRNALYEPEIFSGIIFRNIKPYKGVFLVFSTGKVVLTGIKKKDNIEPTLIFLGKLLKEKKLFL